MGADAEIVARERGPDFVGVGAGLPQHPHLEQRPGHVHHDAGVPAAKAVGQRHGVAQPALLPRRLRHVERDEVAERLREGIAVGPIGKGRTGPDRRDVDGVSRLVEQLGEIVEAALPVGGKHPRLSRLPPAAAEARACPEIGIGDRSFSLAWSEVVADPERGDVGAEGLEDVGIEALEPLGGNERTQLPARFSRGVIPVPRLDQRVGSGNPPGFQQ